jgi:hypothetical protein
MLMDEKVDFGDISAISFADGSTPRVVTGSLRNTVERPLFLHADLNLIQNEAATSLTDVSPMQPPKSIADSAQDPPENDSPDTESEAYSLADQSADVAEVRASDHETVRGIIITREVEVIVVCL